MLYTLAATLGVIGLQPWAQNTYLRLSIGAALVLNL